MELCGRQKVVQRKMVLLGDGACGKTSALNVFTRGFFPTVYEPTVFENYVHDIFVDNVHMELSLWDTAGQEEFDRLRALSYEDTHVIMLCFSVDSPDSFENVATKWIDEIRENCPGVKLVLTALKCDLRKDDELNDNPNAITFEQGLAKAKEIGAVKYLECSAVQNRGIRETFYEAAKVALDVKPAGSSGSKGQCIIL
ncbi:Rho GTPase Rho3 [Aspergillus udagawae]|uniref:GTP-binding protein RHO3 n=7 Tax=Aspergillus subgen. Fumigati TaxID=2720872 RepID=E9RB80_ASPFU|nr:Rho GTPase Rho3 [Aspergillus novofumigatus IBT 16806]XP_033413784.1 Rho GTPase Rho3 [Aspergillus lentulus]XP_043143870.1 rho GTPase [Aspergillus udagawae]XP_043158052.1 rho GTPase [Aspergillus pseudoviridinutans]XP_754937.1 Rho GTPase Rho3 [Aspergillus fumigatus Af293]AAG12156.1 GTPase Rho2 [Aspergillus fumigatus]EDP53065.1 Rho GTPase Rho3 [Aspergillus fumigatus A1163]KMK60674.1 Rho GTPase Rho3 [Aspergillus fumigatus Z5]EAL92899.1 Rho GTPase Rho3 [Aspergillus fumigatus Af293]KAH1275565.